MSLFDGLRLRWWVWRLPEIKDPAELGPPPDGPQDSFEGLGAGEDAIRTPKEAIKWARGHMTWPPGYCLQWVRSCYNVAPLYPDAATAWKHARYKHPLNSGGKAPRGAPVYWTGGSRGYGHIALGLGKGYCLSTDAGGSGRVAKIKIDKLTAWWGHHFQGWAEDVNGVRVYNRKKRNKKKDELEQIMAWYKNKAEFEKAITEAARAAVDSSKTREELTQHRKTMGKRAANVWKRDQAEVKRDKAEVKAAAARVEEIKKALGVVEAALENKATREDLANARDYLEASLAALLSSIGEG